MIGSSTGSSTCTPPFQIEEVSSFALKKKNCPEKDIPPNSLEFLHSILSPNSEHLAHSSDRSFVNNIVYNELARSLRLHSRLWEAEMESDCQNWSSSQQPDAAGHRATTKELSKECARRSESTWDPWQDRNAREVMAELGIWNPRRNSKRRQVRGWGSRNGCGSLPELEDGLNSEGQSKLPSVYWFRWEETPNIASWL